MNTLVELYLEGKKYIFGLEKLDKQALIKRSVVDINTSFLFIFWNILLFPFYGVKCHDNRLLNTLGFYFKLETINLSCHQCSFQCNFSLARLSYQVKESRMEMSVFTFFQNCFVTNNSCGGKPSMTWNPDPKQVSSQTTQLLVASCRWPQYPSL